MKRFLFIGALILFSPLPSHAQGNHDYGYNSVEGDQFRFDDMTSQEPDIPVIKYMKIDKPTSLRTRVDQLLYGIKFDIPPEYDHYGYEMRRYMARIAGLAVIADEKRIQQELKNIAHARIVYKFWQESLLNEISALEKDIAEGSPSNDVRTSFKYNSAIVTAFLTECQLWLDNNEAFLKFLAERQGKYRYSDQNIYFTDEADRRELFKIYKKATESRAIMNGYVSFATMVY